MTHYRSLNHWKCACQYHVVFIPKYRKKAIYGELRQYLGEVLRRLARQRESEVEEGHLLVDPVHRMLSIPPKYSVAQVIGYIKGKSAIHIAREFAGRSRSFVGQHFWARGYFVSTLGRDERAIRAYIRTQELEDRRHEQLRLDERSHPSGGPSGRVAATSGRFERLTTKAPGFAGGYLRVPGMPDSLEVRVLYPPDGGEGLAKRKGGHREVASEGSVEQMREPMNKNRIGGDRDRTSERKVAKSISVKGHGRKSGGCAQKAVGLTPGDLCRCPGNGTEGTERNPERGAGVSRGHIRWRTRAGESGSLTPLKARTAPRTGRTERPVETGIS